MLDFIIELFALKVKFSHKKKRFYKAVAFLQPSNRGLVR